MLLISYDPMLVLGSTPSANVTVLDLTQPAPSRPGCTDGDAGAGPSTAGPAAPPKTERMVQIPEKDAGRMIERDGQTLKGLEQRSKVHAASVLTEIQDSFFVAL